LISDRCLELRNGEAASLSNLPFLSRDVFSTEIKDRLEQGFRLASFFASSSNQRGEADLIAVLACETTGTMSVFRSVPLRRYPSLTPAFPQAHLFEREIAENSGVIPDGHPWLKPVRFPMEDGGPLRPKDREYFKVRGDEVHEVAVGPIHAGVIEPGHFRFQVHGETVLHLEIALGYQHRGVERALRTELSPRSFSIIETAAGDTTIGHTLAFCQALEALAGMRVPARAQALRAAALELERLANHIGDLGAMAGDVGYLPTAAYCGRLRGDILNLTALICGSRFGRGFVRPGGTAFDVMPAEAEELRDRLTTIVRDVTGAVNLLWNSNSVRARFEETAPLDAETATSLGLVGVAARACGRPRDVRVESPFGFYRFFQIPISTSAGGDVFARAFVRWMEIERSAEFLLNLLRTLPDGPVRVETRPSAEASIAVSLTEGWRGEICHVVMTDERRRLTAVKIVDPSFHNWFGLAQAMRGQAISDFPLVNKSFNLSYCGFDL